MKNKNGILKFALIIAITTTFVTPAMAKTYWVCTAIVPMSKRVGAKIGLLGPGLKWIVTFNAYMTVFENDDDFANATQFNTKYETEYLGFLSQSGYQINPQISYGGTTSGCFPKQTDAAARTAVNNITSDTTEQRLGATTMKPEMNPIYVQWKPTKDAAAPQTNSQTQTGGTAANDKSEINTETNVALGIKVQTLSAQSAELSGLKDTKGVMIMDVISGSPAEKSGFKKLDIITEISGQPVEQISDIKTIISRFRAGYNSSFHVWRDKAFADIPVTISADLIPPTEAQQAEAAKAAANQELANQVADAVKSALEAETKARTKAKEAEEVAAKAREIATQAEEAARKAENGEKGYIVEKYKLNLSNVYKDVVSYAGQAIINGNDNPSLGVFTYKSVKDSRYSGQMTIMTNEAGARPNLYGFGVEYAPSYTMAGKWKNGRNEALLVATFNNDIQYGEYKQGGLNGLALVVYKGKTQGQFSAGEFKDNKLNGYGVAILNSGKRGVGQFKNNLMDGYGITYAADGSVLQQGIWKNGELVTPLQ